MTPENGTEITPLVTTIGRKTGLPRTVRIRIYYWNGRMIATSPYPRMRRSWVRNLMDHPEATIESQGRTVKARAQVLPDRETAGEIARFRISWRTDHCPVLQPSTDTFVEFFPEAPAESFYTPEAIRHSPTVDPLAGSTLDEILAWQDKGGFYKARVEGARAGR
jgi:deazaflavin-dependent oxidoreductase (nitroreductase family)